MKRRRRRRGRLRRRRRHHKLVFHPCSPSDPLSEDVGVSSSCRICPAFLLASTESVHLRKVLCAAQSSTRWIDLSPWSPPVCHRPYSRSHSVLSALRCARYLRSLPSPFLPIEEEVEEESDEVFLADEVVVSSPPPLMRSESVPPRSVPLVVQDFEVEERSSSPLLSSPNASTLPPSHTGVVEVLPAVSGPLRARFTQFLKDTLQDSRSFSPAMLRKASKNLILAAQQEQSQHAAPSMVPHAFDVEAMFSQFPECFQSGSSPIPSTSLRLNAAAFESLHIQSCPQCAEAKQLLPDCRGSALKRCLTHGWRVPVDESNIHETYPSFGNSPNLDKYPKSYAKALQKQLDFGAITEVPIDEIPFDSYVISPAGAVLKNSDAARSLALTNVAIVDQSSLEEANTQLESLHFPPVKIRPTVNLTQSGVNGAAPRKTFSYGSIAEPIQLIERNCFLAHADISNFYPHFPFAVESQHLFITVFKAMAYIYTFCLFGFSLCPYFTCTFGAEIRRFVTFAGIPSAHMLDDWFTVGSTEDQASSRLQGIITILEVLGFVIAAEKTAISQRLVHLGFLFDTVAMTISFDAINARAFAQELRGHRATLASGGNLAASVVDRICGKLNNYAEVLQGGRARIRSWYAYEHYREHFSPVGRKWLLADTDFWLSVLDTWASGATVAGNFPLLSPAELAAHPSSIHMLTSDASGPHGIGLFHGSLASDDPLQFEAAQWSSDSDFLFSQHGELAGIIRFLQTTQTNLSLHAEVKLLLWLTDSQSAALSINSGTARNLHALAALKFILDECDARQWQIVALWAPREDNELLVADFLSHFAFSLHRASVYGSLSDSPATASSGDRHRDVETFSSKRGTVLQVPDILPPALSFMDPSDVSASGAVCSRLHVSNQVHSLPGISLIAVESRDHGTPFALADVTRRDSSEEANSTASLRGYIAEPPQIRPPPLPPDRRRSSHGPLAAHSAVGGGRAHGRPRRTSSRRGTYVQYSGSTNHVVASQPRVHPPLVSH